MSGRTQNLLLIIAVVVLVVLPLMTIGSQTSGTVGKGAFTGADGQVAGVIQELAPGYLPWFSAIIKPPSSEIESLLFALQAALGSGVLGYYFGYCRGRVKKSAETDRSSHAA